MSKYLKLFNQDAEYKAFKESEEYILPNVSFVESDNVVYYNPYEEAKEARLVCTYNVTDTTSATQVCSDTSYFTSMEVDGVLQDSITTEYTFNSIGEHAVKFELADPTTIGNDAFQSCTGLTSIVIPDSVTYIGEDAFSSCSGLTSVHIGSGVTTIRTSAFGYCTSLTSINIPDSVTTIESYAFDDCTSLPVEDNIRYADTYLVKAVNQSLSTYTIKEGTKFIGDSAFYYCSNLTSIVIPDSVITIDGRAFYMCLGLTEVHIGSGVTTIGSSAFGSCDSLPVENNLRYADTYLVGAVNKSLSTYTIKEDTKWIGNDAFQSCTGLTSIVIPDSVTKIGYQAFYRCSGLTGELVIPDSVTNIENRAFMSCSGLTSVHIGSGVTSIGDQAFYSCSGLTSINIPDSVTSIGDSAFYGCASLPVENGLCYADTYLVGLADRSLSTYVIKAGTKWIGSGIFTRCWNVTSIVIPDSVTYIGGGFSECYNLKSITCKAMIAPTMHGNKFYGVGDDGILTVPAGSDYSTWMSTDEYYLGCYNWRMEYIIELPDDFEDSIIMTSESNPIAMEICYKKGWAASPNQMLASEAYVVSYIGTAFAESNITSFNEFQYFVNVKEIGNEAFSNCSGLTSIVIPDSVTSIGGNAFNYCSGLTSVEIGSGVTSIGDAAFIRCGLTSINIPDSVTSIGEMAFNECYGLTSVHIGSGVTAIGVEAFSNCTGLTSINIPDSVTTIEVGAFGGCESLTDVHIGSGVTTIGMDAFAFCTSLPVENNLRYADTYLVEAVDRSLSTYTIKAGTKWIGDGVFNGYKLLTSIVIPDSVTSIGGYAFAYCFNLTSINIPDSVTYIGESAFEGCESLPVEDNLRYVDTYLIGAVDKSLSTYTIKEGTKWIGEAAFSRCSGLTSIIIPDSVTYIGNNAFNGCSGLTSINIPDLVTTIGNQAFEECSGLTSINIPDSVTYIGFGAFSSCSSLTSVVIPDSVTNIGNYAFQNCSGLTDVHIGSGVTSIGEAAFVMCTSLTDVHIGSGVTSIGGNAFGSCSSLSEITCNAITAPTIDRTAFQYIKKGGILKVPAGSDYSTWMSTSYYYLGSYNWTIEYI